jgi:hypothetical protein
MSAAPNCVTVLAALQPGADLGLRGVLRAIGDDIKGKQLSSARPHVDFPASRAIHFARFGILSDPGRGPGRTRLLYAAVYDGDLASHLAELVSITSDMSAIWGGCEGYTDATGFAAFIAQHTQPAEAYYAAFRDETVASIRRAIEFRRDLQAQQDIVVLNVPPTPILNRDLLRRVIRALPLPWDGAKAIARYGFNTVYQATRKITAGLDRYPVFRLFNAATRNHLAPMRSHFSSVAPDTFAAPAPLAAGDEIPAAIDAANPGMREDVVSQNQLTLVTVIDPSQVTRVRAVMAAIDSFAKRLSPPGSLIGISTIHFVRWMVIDGGQRLMLVSDYDGSWESYIDEFAEMILSGLDAIWETSLSYPPDGGRDLPAFKRFLRNHQVPSQVFFSAYPEETVLNILNDTALAAHHAGKG